MKRNLTDRTVKALKAAPVGKQYDCWDARFSGFGVRVSDTGRCTFVLLTRYPGSRNPTRRALGQYGALTLEKARDKARDWLELIRKGIDPAIAEKREREERAREQANTFAAVAERFIEYIHAQKERKAPEVEADLRRVFIKLWGARPVTEITPEDVADVIEAVARRGKQAQAHNLYGHIHRLFRWAHPRLVKHSPCADLSPKRMIGERRTRTRTLTDDELRAFWRATGRMKYPFGPVYRLLAFSALRLNEACGARRSEFNLGLEQIGNDESLIPSRSWLIAAERMKKTGREAKPHLVPLTDDMLALIESLPKIKGAEFLFSANAGKSPIVRGSFGAPKARLDRRMLRSLKAAARKRGDDPDRVTLRPWVNHDIRRTVRTHLSALRVPEEAREAVLAHTREGSKRNYDQYQYANEKREALTLWAARLRSIVEPQPANVVKLTKPKARVRARA